MQWNYLCSEIFYWTCSKYPASSISRIVHWFRKMCQLHLGIFLNKGKWGSFRKKKKRWSLCLLNKGIRSSKCCLLRVANVGRKACLGQMALSVVTETTNAVKEEDFSDPVLPVNWTWDLQKPWRWASLAHPSALAPTFSFTPLSECCGQPPNWPRPRLWAKLVLMAFLKLQPNSYFTGTHCSTIHS